MQQWYQCPRCGCQNAVGQRFCGDCGEGLIKVCPQCGADVPLQYEFCGNCGTSLTRQQDMPPSQSYQQQYRMNWFQRHLNWSLVIVILVGGMLAGYTDMLFYPWRLLIIPITLFGVITVIWYLRRKNRSIGWWFLIVMLGAAGAGASQSTLKSDIPMTEIFVVFVFVPGLIGLCYKDKSKSKKQLDVKDGLG